MVLPEKVMSGKRLIAVGGLSGSGKTSLAGALQNKIPNAVHVDADATRRKILGLPETGPFPKDSFSTEVTQSMIIEMHRLVKEGLAAGKCVIVSSIFDTPSSRIEQERLAAGNSAQFKGLWLQADENLLIDRVISRINDVSEAGADVVQAQFALGVGTITWHIIDAAQTREEIIQAALEAL